MNQIAARSIATALLLALAACSSGDQTPVKAAPPPKKDPVTKNVDLLADPKDDAKDPKADVFTSKLTAASFPGLKVKTLKAGEGEATLEFGKIGMLHIKGRLASGKEFKNTRAAETPQELIMMEWGDLQGLVLGVVGMKKGERRSLTVPPELAYGERGSPRDEVQQNATIFLDVELVEIKEGLDEEFLVRRLAEGKGDPIRIGQRGQFNYTGILTEGDRAGEVFDSSRKPDRVPFPMAVGTSGAIEGWLKGGIGMRVGEKRWLKIPSKLAYADSGSPDGSIPPNAILIFEMELMSIDG